MDQLDIASTAWVQYTMELDLIEPMNQEDEDIVMLGKLTTCTPAGILVLTRHDAAARMNILFFNMHTRCQVNQLVLERGFEMRGLFAADSNTIIITGSVFTFEERERRAEPRYFARIYHSADGFQSFTETEVTLSLPPSRLARYPDFCLTIGEGFVFAMREFERMYRPGAKIDFFYVPFSGLLAPSTLEQKWFAAVPFGSMPAMGEARFIPIPYSRTSFAVLKGDAGRNRIDVYDINNPEVRSITVFWPLPTTFPTAIVQVLPFNGTRSALMQTVTGGKLRLDLESGGVQSTPSFIPTASHSLKIGKYVSGSMSRSEREVIGVDADSDDEDDFPDEDNWTPIEDEVYLTAGLSTVDESIIGWFAEERENDAVNDDDEDMEDEEENVVFEDRITMLRMPIGKVHSLFVLASNAVCGLLNKKTRMRITKESNPTSIAEFVRAILEN